MEVRVMVVRGWKCSQVTHVHPVLYLRGSLWSPASINSKFYINPRATDAQTTLTTHQYQSTNQGTTSSTPKDKRRRTAVRTAESQAEARSSNAAVVVASPSACLVGPPGLLQLPPPRPRTDARDRPGDGRRLRRPVDGRRLPQRPQGAAPQADRHPHHPRRQRHRRLPAALRQVGAGAAARPQPLLRRQGLRVGRHPLHRLHARAPGLLQQPQLALPPRDAVAPVPLHHLRRHARRRLHAHGRLPHAHLLQPQEEGRRSRPGRWASHSQQQRRRRQPREPGAGSTLAQPRPRPRPRHGVGQARRRRGRPDAAPPEPRRRSGSGDGHRGALGGDRAGHGGVAERVHHPAAGGGHVLPPDVRGDGPRRMHPPGRVWHQDEGRPRLLLLHHHALRDRARPRAHQGLQGQQPHRAHRRRHPQRRLRRPPALHGARRAPRRRLHGAQAAGQRQAPAHLPHRRPPRRRRHVRHGQMGVTY